MPFLLLLSFSLTMLCSVEDAASHRVESHSQIVRTFWDELKLNLNEFNLKLLSASWRAFSHLVPSPRTYFANHTTFIRPLYVN